MAMIDCSECGAKISSSAQACPKCGGNPDSGSVRLKKSIARIVIVLGLIFIILAFWTNHVVN